MFVKLKKYENRIGQYYSVKINKKNSFIKEKQAFTAVRNLDWLGWLDK
jgi:hypothetical protein